MNGADRPDVSDAFRDWDAGYVLGALSQNERREYEAHLEGCESCAAAVAELAGLPGLLSKVESAEASALLDGGEAPPPTLLPRLVHTARRRHRRRIVVSTLGLVAAAAALVLIVPLLGGQLWGVPSPVAGAGPSAAPAATVSLSQIVPSPLRASIRLVALPWGTRVEMDCRYANDPGYGAAASSDYAMYVTDAAGSATQIATWTAGPGQNVEPAGTTSLAPDRIDSVEVREVSTGAVLLRGNP